ncbi:MAG: ribosome biogenesis GTPase Der [Clostridiales bacterium]|nr:ribosome biogenesis GTPase Der [Clostridiales bacterium]
MKPIVAIVGRPNVGKSLLFNQIINKRLSIVHDSPGVTRDRIYADAEWLGKEFTLVDTGGLEPFTKELIPALMRQQTEVAIDMATVIIFVVDAQTGMLASDLQVADMLRKSKKPVILCVNKSDNEEHEIAQYEFYNLDIGEPYPVSALHKRGFGELLDAVTDYFPDETEEKGENAPVHVAVLGRPNAGKSSFVNALLGDERVLVSEIAGTTRDAVDTPFEFNGKPYVLIDTAGLVRKRSVDTDIDYYSTLRSMAAVERADIGIIMIDADRGVAEQDAKITGMFHDAGKPCVLVLNKWDLIDKDTHTIEEYKKTLYDTLSFVQYAPCITISAKTGQRVKQVMQLVEEIYEQSTKRITTGVLNDALRQATILTEPPSKNGRQLKIYFGTQVSVQPPTFVLSVNSTELFHFSYERYLINHLRRTFGFDMVPIKIIAKGKGEEQ